MDVRAQLLAAALKVYAEVGSRGATTRRIAHVAGVNEVTLFRHFGSKDALLREALLHATPPARAVREVTLPEKPVDPEAELLAFCRHQYQAVHQARSIIRKCMGEFEEHPDMSQAACQTPVLIANELQAYVQRLRTAGLASGDWNARAATTMLMGALFSDALGRDCMQERYPYSEREGIRHYVTLFLRAIGVQVAEGQKVTKR